MSLEDRREEIEHRLRLAQTLLEGARQMYEEDPCDVNDAALGAAERIMEEEIAWAQEWTV